MSKFIVEGTLVSHDKPPHKGQVEVDLGSGVITRVGENLGTADIAGDFFIFPGFVDVHVHAREDASQQQVYKEDFLSMSEAALQGGVVHVADMPNNPIPPVDEQSYIVKQKLSQKSLVGVTLYAAIGPATKPLGFLVPYKVFMGKSVGDIFFENRSNLEAALEKYRGQNVSFHCEDPEIMARNKDAPTHEGRRPREAEISAIKTALELIKKYELKGKICHVSTTEGAELIVSAKKQGVSVTAEVTPHHIYFDAATTLTMNPPLRDLKDRQKLLDYLKRGDIDFLATDHAPHTLQEKAQGISGLPHLDTYGLFAAWLIKEKGFSLQNIARVCSFNPGSFVNQFQDSRLGKIEAGYEGSLTILDLNSATLISRENLKTKCGWSPFEGIEFPGRLRYTVVKGKVYKT